MIAEHEFGVVPVRRVGSYVAIGDSFTAGNGCRPEQRWSDRLARGLTAAGQGIRYRNLAVDGANSEQVLSQVEPALRRDPDLITITCGANDVLKALRPEVGPFAERLDLILDQLEQGRSKPAIMTITYPEDWEFTRLGPRTQARVGRGIREVNQVIRDASAARELPCFEVADHPGLSDRSNFEQDGLHPSALGHRRAAHEIGIAMNRRLGIAVEIETEDGPSPDPSDQRPQPRSQAE